MTPSQKLQFMQRIRRLKRKLDERRVSPRNFVGTVLHAWTQRSFPGLPGPSLPNYPSLLQTREAESYVEKLLAQPFLESAYWLSSAYALLSDEAYRKSLAMFFTPPSLTNRLLDDVQSEGADFATHTFFDPACGGAAFLAPIAMRMRNSLRVQGLSSEAILAHVESHLFGSDLDETLCELSRHFLRMALADEIAVAGRQPLLKVHRANSLTDIDAVLGQLDVIVCNPPYRKLRRREVTRLRKMFSEVIEAQPNLYGLFLVQAIRFVKEGGLAAFVTPTSFLSGSYFSQLRRHLAANADVLSIGMVSDRRGVFIDVEHETALTVLRRQPAGDQRPITPRIAVVSSDGLYRQVGRCTLPRSGVTWSIPRSEADATLLAGICESKFRLADYGYTARIGAFVWNRDTRPVFESLVNARRANATSAVPLIWSSDIRPSGALIFNGRAKANGEPRFVDLGDKKHRSIVRNASVVLQRVTSNDQPRRLVAAPIPASLLTMYGGYVGENHTVILEQVGPSPALDPPQLAQLLSTHVIDRIFRSISSSTNVSVYELNQLSLPDPTVLARLIDTGMDIENAVGAALSGGSSLQAAA